MIICFLKHILIHVSLARQYFKAGTFVYIYLYVITLYLIWKPIGATARVVKEYQLKGRPT